MNNSVKIMENGSATTLVIIGVFVVLTLIGIFLFFETHQPRTTANYLNFETHQPRTTANYLNSEYGFSMYFPAGWQRELSSNPEVAVAEGNNSLNAVLQVLVTPIPSAVVGREDQIPQTFGNYFPSNYPDTKILSSNPVTLAGQNAYEGEFEFLSGNTLLGNVIVAFAYEGNLYQIIGTTPLSEYQSVSSQLFSIINSFDFTK